MSGALVVSKVCTGRSACWHCNTEYKALHDEVCAVRLGECVDVAVPAALVVMQYQPVTQTLLQPHRPSPGLVLMMAACGLRTESQHAKTWHGVQDCLSGSWSYIGFHQLQACVSWYLLLLYKVSLHLPRHRRCPRPLTGLQARLAPLYRGMTVCARLSEPLCFLCPARRCHRMGRRPALVCIPAGC